MDTTTVRVKALTDDERELINLLSTAERKQVLIDAARAKAERLLKELQP